MTRRSRVPTQWWDLVQRFSTEALARYYWEKWQGRYPNEGFAESIQQHRKKCDKIIQESTMPQVELKPAVFPYGSMQDCNTDKPSKIALKSVAVSGEVHGLLFTYSITQSYKNQTSRPLEVIYTFPIAWGTAVLGMSAKIGEKSFTGEVVEKKKAERQYENAIFSGDSAIMVEKSATGLYTANLGNIDAGESVTVELHCARMLRIEQNRVRLCIPTVISQRYGNAYGPDALASHESDAVSDDASYALSVHIAFYGDMAKGKITCPSHSLEAQVLPNGGIAFGINGPAVLDRDFVLLAENVAVDSYAQCVTVGEETLVAASFVPNLPENASSPVACKILLDCSGSMGGERIDQAIHGLHKIHNLLREDDYISYTRFGSDVRQIIGEMRPCTEETSNAFADAIEKTYADMGGTELKKALKATYDIETPSEIPAAILLITDGDVWEVDSTIAKAASSGQRVFAIGVGAAPAESLLRELAEKTGGACELVTPKENMADAIVRMFTRMRQGFLHDVHVAWQGDTVWKSKTPKYLYKGETLHCFALMRGGVPSSAPVLYWHAAGGEYAAMAERIEKTASHDLFRLAMTQRLNDTGSVEEKKRIALKYQLISKNTSLILVYERADGKKIVGLPTVQKAPQMSVARETRLDGNFRVSDVSYCILGGNAVLRNSLSKHFDIFDKFMDPCVSFCRIPETSVNENLYSQTKNDCKISYDINTLLNKYILKLRNKLSDLLDEKNVNRVFEQITIKDSCMLQKFCEISSSTSIPINIIFAIFILWANSNDMLVIDRHILRSIREKTQDLTNEQIENIRRIFNDWVSCNKKSDCDKKE